MKPALRAPNVQLPGSARSSNTVKVTDPVGLHLWGWQRIVEAVYPYAGHSAATGSAALRAVRDKGDIQLRHVRNATP